jgi:hypothetical protein
MAFGGGKHALPILEMASGRGKMAFPMLEMAFYLGKQALLTLAMAVGRDFRPLTKYSLPSVGDEVTSLIFPPCFEGKSEPPHVVSYQFNGLPGHFVILPAGWPDHGWESTGGGLG